MIFFRNKKKYFFITLFVFIIIYLFISIFSSFSIFSFSNEESLDTSIDYEQLISDHESYPIINSDDFILKKLELDIKFDNPWAIKLIDDNQLIISEKNGLKPKQNLAEIEKKIKDLTK